MQYKVIRVCAGFRGQYWTKGTIVDIDPAENPPKHFVPLEAVPPTPPKVSHRTEPLELAPGQNRPVVGGLAAVMNNQHEKIPRIQTQDPIQEEPPVKEEPKKSKRTRRKKIAGSVKRSS